jgi:hypothetical protein
VPRVKSVLRAEGEPVKAEGSILGQEGQELEAEVDGHDPQSWWRVGLTIGPAMCQMAAFGAVWRSFRRAKHSSKDLCRAVCDLPRPARGIVVFMGCHDLLLSPQLDK